MTSGLPGIALVVPSLNQGRFLGAALESIFRQGYPCLSVAVMDGGSTDDSVAVISRYAERLTHWQSGPDGGQSAAINEGLGRTSGELIAWLNADDFYWGDALWTVARAWAEFPGHAVYVGNGFRLRQRDGRLTPFCPRHVALNRDALIHGLDYVLQPATFFSRRAWEEAGGLAKELRFCMDWDVIIRIARRHPAVLINEFLAVSREHEETKTRTGKLARVAEISGMVRAHSRRELTPGDLHYQLEALLDVADRQLPAELRGHLAGAMEALRREFARRWGNADGFPERGDPQDRVYLPLVSDADPLRPRPAGVAELPPLSIVMPSFNQAAFLGQALDSVLRQGYPRVELLVVDGGSTDGSVDLLRTYAPRLAYWVSEPDRGPAHAINKGLRRASGEVLGWLNSDDMLAHDALREVGRAFAEDPELDMVYGNALYIDERNRLHLVDHGDHRTALYHGAMQPPARIPAYWSYVHAVPQPTVFFRRRLLETCGYLDESRHFIFDFELFSRFAGRAKVRKLERTQAFYRIHAAAKTSDWTRFLVELYRFSRPRWPSWHSREFPAVLGDYMKNLSRRRFGGRPHTPGEWLALVLAGLSALTRVGNPEALLSRSRRGQGHAPLPEATAATAAVPYECRVVRREPRYRSLFCSLIWPRHPGLFGGEIRDFHPVRHLLGISTVEFFSIHDVPADDRLDWLAPELEALHLPAPRRRVSDPGLTLVRLRDRLVRELVNRGLPVPGRRYHWDAAAHLPAAARCCRAALQEALVRQRPDFLFVSPQTNPVALSLDTAGLPTRLILATYDVEVARIRSFADSEHGMRRVALALEVRRAVRFERENLARYDGVIAVSAKEQRIFVDTYGLAPERVLVIDNSVDPQYFAFVERQPTPTPHVVFVGTLSYLANQQAAWRLVRDIMPRVRQCHPDARLWIVGQQPAPALLAASDGLRTVVTGAVEDVRPYLAQAAAACMPLRAGAGTKYKILEALSVGVPVACTAAALDGLDLADGRDLLVGESDAELAALIVRLIDDRETAARLARQGRAAVEQRYAWDANLPRLDGWLAQLAALPLRRAARGQA